MMRPRGRLGLGVAGAVIGLAVVAVALVLARGGGEASTLTVFGPAPAFSLTDQMERPVRSDELRGTVIVANFVYTSCKDVCPLLSNQMQNLGEQLRREGLLGPRVQLLSITVDPARDTPAVLRAYAARFGADLSVWRFLTGPEAAVVPLIVNGFKLGVDALPPTAVPEGQNRVDGAQPDYDVAHSTRFVLIDRRWQIRAYYDGRELDFDRIERDIRDLLR